MASDPKQIFVELKAREDHPKIALPEQGLDHLVQEIFRQAHDHRKLLIRFYIWYTCVLSCLVMALLFWQAAARFFVHGDSRLELIPQWALDLVVVGMFGQFIGLLNVVTKKVWGFKSFFDHARSSSTKVSVKE